MRIGQILGVGVLACLLVASDCGRLGPVEDCWDGLRVGDLVELELVEPYTRDTPYTWIEYLDPDRWSGGAPSCGGIDGLGPGRYVWRVAGRQSDGATACAYYWVTPLHPLGDVDFAGVVRPLPGGLVSATVPHCGGYWKLGALREPDQGRDAFGEEATPGRRPPLVVQRTISGDCGVCFDQWVAEIRHVDLDAGSPDGG